MAQPKPTTERVNDLTRIVAELQVRLATVEEELAELRDIEEYDAMMADAPPRQPLTALLADLEISDPQIADQVRHLMQTAQYEQLEDGSIYGSIPDVAGVWANEQTRSACEDELASTLADMLAVAAQDPAGTA